MKNKLVASNTNHYEKVLADEAIVLKKNVYNALRRFILSASVKFTLVVTCV